MLCSQVWIKNLRQIITIRHIHKPKKFLERSQKKENEQHQEQTDYKYVPYMKTFNMLTNATIFEAKHTDIDEIHPSTQANKVSNGDWVKDLEQRKQERERKMKSQAQKSKTMRNDKKNSHNDFKKKESKGNNYTEIRHDNKKLKANCEPFSNHSNEKKGNKLFSNG